VATGRVVVARRCVAHHARLAVPVPDSFNPTRGALSFVKAAQQVGHKASERRAA